jgi:FkbM family methyltransferase
MKLSLRSLRAYYYRMVSAQSVFLSGVKVYSGATLPEDVREQLYRGTYELGERELLGSAVQHSDRVLEFGAGMGIIGLVASRMVGPQGAVLSIEANSTLEPLILSNQRLNAAKIVPPQLVFSAVNSDGRDVRFHCNIDILSSSIIDRGKQSTSVKVPGRMASELVDSFKPTVLIMDIEGSEVEVVLSIPYAGIRAAVIEIHEKLIGPDNVVRILAHLESQGFTLMKKLHGNYLFQRG